MGFYRYRNYNYGRDISRYNLTSNDWLFKYDYLKWLTIIFIRKILHVSERLFKKNS